MAPQSIPHRGSRLINYGILQILVMSISSSIKYLSAFKKLPNRIRLILVKKIRNNFFYPFIYYSYLHSLFNRPGKHISEPSYLAAVPNRGAGIGHQMANWNAGLWFSHKFGLHFAHIPFSSKKWENFLGFGDKEITADDLIHVQGYRKVLLPLFNESDIVEVGRIQKIIASYADTKVLFMLEQDQGYDDQFGVLEVLQQKFYTSKNRVDDRLQFSIDYYNIAIHVRRGDIVAGQVNGNKNLLMRWQDSNYFENVLSLVLENIKQAKPIKIYLFSQGKKEDFFNFEKFGSIQYCLEMDAHDSFLHMVNADLLITSKSSFSYKPALLSRGIKICPRDFWHGYPDQPDWILADENGALDVEKFKKINLPEK